MSTEFPYINYSHLSTIFNWSNENNYLKDKDQAENLFSKSEEERKQNQMIQVRGDLGEESNVRNNNCFFWFILLFLSWNSK